MNVFRSVRDRSHNRYAAYQGNTDALLWRLADVIYRTWDLGFTAFGGPPVHFQIWRRRFVEGIGGSPWVDEQTVSVTSKKKKKPRICHYRSIICLCTSNVCLFCLQFFADA